MKSPDSFFKKILISVFAVACPLLAGAADGSQRFHSWAATPPMGWNSWDCFATTLTETQTKAQADYMAGHLKKYGWQYIVVDIQWYEPGATGYDYRKNAPLVMDEWGRLLPAENRFPSAADSAGFKPLADYVHSLGLKFGIHLMRGIPRLAVERNLPVKGTKVRAQDIADKNSLCPWNPDMYGVDMSKPGAQEYYDSVFALIASWGVDYVKVDDISRPYHDHDKEIEAVRKAIDRTKRPMVLSLSPGETDITAADHVKQHANLWRISDDFWDNWPALHEQFARLHRWNPHRRPGAWPDADMLPFGVIDLGKRTTRFTKDEQYTVMTLWSIARSPLMHGGDMTKMDEFTLSLLTNQEVLAVNQRSDSNRPLFDRDNLIGWTADVPGSDDKYVALFNARDRIDLSAERAAFRGTVSREAGPHGVEIDLDVKGASALVLMADPTADGNPWDHALWIDPRVIMADGSERSLLDGLWSRGDAFWSNLSTSKAPGGGPMSHDGKPVVRGIGAHSPALIEYALPAGAIRFKTKAALDDAAVKASKGGTIEFRVFLSRPGDGSERPGLPVEVVLKDLGITGPVMLRDLWAKKDIGVIEERFAPVIAWHGAGLFRVSPVVPRAVAAGPFNPSWDSLKNYEVPGWFRDAKFGIWSHWGPQCVPEQGDWYARNLYIEGHRQNKHHLATYGHPSEFGYKDIVTLWKAEKFDPDALMDKYAKAGAKYFVSMAVHHDNFDLWNSKNQHWNAVELGPQRDIVAAWGDAARKRGLRFGVSEHLERTYSWFNTSKGADKKGGKTGVPYDGNDARFVDLYLPKHDDTSEVYPKHPSREWQLHWLDRIIDLIDQSRPDFLYTDGGVPFGAVGQALMAHFYNRSIDWNQGRLEAVYTIKDHGADHGEYFEGIAVQDLERRVLPGVKPEPWQTCSSVADWFYSRNHPYKSATEVIHMLADIVSKNGNLLLNFTQRPDGSLDPESDAILAELAAWMPANGEAIFGTRPWRIYGEGPAVASRGSANFVEGRDKYTAADIRFTTKGDTLYAIVLGWPGAGGAVTISSLAATVEPARIAGVKLLGSEAAPAFVRDADGLKVTMPEKAPGNHAIVLKIDLHK